MKRVFSMFLIAAMSLLTACSQIDTGNVGVIKTGGQYKAEEMSPGWHFTLFSTVFEVSTKENSIQFNDMKPKTADQITVEDLDIDVYYQMNPAKAQETMVKLAGDLAKNQDGDYVPGYNYVSRIARESAYNIMATVKASDAQQKRGSIPADIQKSMQEELDKKFEKGWFVVTNVNLRNLTVDSKLEAAIRDAAQVQYQIEAKQKQVELAKAEADRQRAIAQGEADSARIKADGLRTAQGADYLKLLEIQNQAEAIKKWDGKLPSTVAGGATPMIGVGAK
jgi:regulator of protease activity HflC (stomatin/prohibitin superfamily)